MSSAVTTGSSNGPAIHLNGHFDVVPGRSRLDARSVWRRRRGWPLVRTRVVRHESRHCGSGVRGRSDSPLRRSAAAPIDISGTVDEESGGFAGVGWLAEHRVDLARAHQGGDHSRAVRRRSRLHRPSRRLLVRGDRRRPHRARQHAVSRRQRHRRHVALSRSGPRRAQSGALPARHGDAGRARRIAPRDHQHQRHRRRPAGRRCAEPVRRGSVPRGVRSPIPPRGRPREDARRDRARCCESAGADAGGQIHDRRSA